MRTSVLLLALTILATSLAYGASHEVRAYTWVRLTVANNSTSPYPLPFLSFELPLNDTYQLSTLVNFTVRIEGIPAKCQGRIVTSDCGSKRLGVACPTVLPPFSTAEIEVVSFVHVRLFSAPQLSIERSGELDDIPKELRDLTLPTGLWSYDNPRLRYLAEAALRLVGGERRVLAIVANLVKWIWGKIDYEVGKGPRYPHETLPPDKVEVGRGRGDCDDQANVLILMLRSLGIPAYLKTALVADFDYGKQRVIWAPEAHYYSAFYGIDYGHAWAEVYVPPWGWLPVDLTFHAQTGDPLDAIRTSATSEAWVRYMIATLRMGNVCREDYIAEFRSWASEAASTPLFYYWEYAVVREGDSIARVKGFLKPLPLPWVRSTRVEVRHPSRAKALEKIELLGSLEPRIGNAPIVVQVRKPSGRVVVLETLTDPGGLWKLEVTLDEAGAWSFNATFGGQPGYAPSSREFTVYVDKLPSQLALSAEQRDGQLAVEGSLKPPIGANVTVIVMHPPGTRSVAYVEARDGTFFVALPVREPGEYKVFAYWPGNEIYEHALASVEVVAEVPTMLRVEASLEDGSVVVEGALEPVVEGAVVIIEALSRGRRVEVKTATGADGTFSTRLELSEGEWTITAVFEGKPGYRPSRAFTRVVVLPGFDPTRLLVALAAALTLLVLLLKRRLRPAG